MRLWFYVPDYPSAKPALEKAYEYSGVLEWAAEPGRVGSREWDADVTVDGEDHEVTSFRSWLEQSGIKGLMIEGRMVS